MRDHTVVCSAHICLLQGQDKNVKYLCHLTYPPSHCAQHTLLSYTGLLLLIYLLFLSSIQIYLYNEYTGCASFVQLQPWHIADDQKFRTN